MGIKERACRDEHPASYGSVESLYRTPETDVTLCVNWNSNRNLKKRENIFFFWILRSYSFSEAAEAEHPMR